MVEVEDTVVVAVAVAVAVAAEIEDRLDRTGVGNADYETCDESGETWGS